MFAQTFSATHLGIEGVVIKIEAAKQNSLPKILITGLPGDVIRESRERVRASLTSLGFDVPTSQILVHLSPASAKKQGSQFDLGIAMSVLVAEGQLKGPLTRVAFLGELGLEGRVRAVRGALSLIESLEAREEIQTILVPKENLREARLVGGNKVRLVEHISDAIEFVEGRQPLESISAGGENAADETTGTGRFLIDHVLGQPLGKRALQIALAGRHHLLMLGPPGVGKSMLAQCSPSLLPDLETKDLMDVIKSYDAVGVHRPWDRRAPFRSPHHSISAAGMLGGGTGMVIPGEVTLAHAGVLFLDEFPEFRKDVIEGMREPIQSGEIHLHRIGHFHRMPARFTLIAAMNPCPCGHSLGESRRCRCPWERITAYRKRISGAMLDRIDLGVLLRKPKAADFEHGVLTHDQVKSDILLARDAQRARYGEGKLNGDDDGGLASPPFELLGEAKEWLDQVRQGHELSFRALAKLTRVSRTVADLAGESRIKIDHLREAWGLRCPDLHHLNA
jgi:magnesium chelatase family protein